MATGSRGLLARRSTTTVERRPGAVLDLDDRSARDPSLAGAKAATLARARALGLPVLPGLVLTTEAADPRADDGLLEAWRRLTDQGRLRVAVRSSSPVEDGATASMAGRFTSVLDVAGEDAFLAAVAEVRASAAGAPMAVLVQPMLACATGGVLFGVDPVSGRRDRLVVAVVEGGPSPLVSGAVTGSRHVLGRRGRLLEPVDGPVRLDRRQRRHLASLAAACARAGGGHPQDLEWGEGADGRLWLLQHRPVTALPAAAEGPVLGPGPVAETLPDALLPLEVDLWVEPLRAGIAEALAVLGATGRRARRRSPVLAVVGGRVAADLTLLGVRPARRPGLARLDPRPPARRLVAAWRVGRLRAALPTLADGGLADADRALAAVPPLASLAPADLLGLLGRSRLALRALHGQEVLAGALLADEGGPTGAAAALGALAAGRAEGLDDATLVARHPGVLALVPPAVRPATALPATPPGPLPIARGTGPLRRRESLRLRARWVQELSARAAAELGQRLADDGALAAPGLVRWLSLDELAAAVDGRAPVPADLLGRAAAWAPGPPLPAAFRLAADGSVRALAPSGGRLGQGAGGGRGAGPVAHLDGGAPPPGSVLVVATLDPGLATSLPGLAGLVAETGSALSHLAILARELGVPTVVGVADALRRFPPGEAVLVDGATGEVEGVGP